MSILIQNGTLILPDGPVSADLRVDGGKIVEDCPKDAFFGDVEARAPRTRQFLSKILQH